MKKLFFLSVILIVALAAVQMVPILAQQPLSPEAVLQKVVDAVNAGNVDAAMVRFADTAFVNLIPPLPPGSPVTISGSKDIRKWIEGLIAIHFKIKVEILAVHGNIVITNTSSWHDLATSLGVAPFVANEIYVIQNGKIMGFTWVMSDDSLKKLTAALAVPLPGPVKVADVVGMWSWQIKVTNLDGSTSWEPGGFYLRFNADGTFRAEGSLEGFDRTTAADVGQFKIDGTRLTLTSGKETQLCRPGDVGTADIALTRGGQLQFTPQKDECEMRRSPSKEPQLFDRVQGK
jgi:hypothetical protein